MRSILKSVSHKNYTVGMCLVVTLKPNSSSVVFLFLPLVKSNLLIRFDTKNMTSQGQFKR